MVMLRNKIVLSIVFLILQLSLFAEKSKREDFTMNLDDVKIDKYIELSYKNVFDYCDWKDGKSIILYGECFSTLEVTEKNKLKIKKLVNFPNDDCIFYTFPDVNVIYGYSGGVTQLFYVLNAGEYSRDMCFFWHYV